MRRNLMTWLLLFAVAFPTVAKAAITAPGDIAFTAFAARSTIADQFKVVFLKAVSNPTTITFTSRNWSNSGGSFSASVTEVSYTWTSGQAYNAGDELEFFNTEPPLVKVFNSAGVSYTNSGTVSVYPANNFLGLSETGDNLLAYLGPQSLTPSTFLAGLVFNGIGWGNGAGDLPTALAGGNYSLSFPASFTGGLYDPTKGNDGSQASLLAVINNTANWNALPNQSNTDLPYNQAVQQPYGPYWDADTSSFTVNSLHTTPTPQPTWTPQANPTSTPVAHTGTLSPGDVAFVSLAARSTIADQFAVVFLKDVPANTTLTFTDDNWDNTSNSFVTQENKVYWTADKFYSKGSVLQFLNTDPYQAAVYGPSPSSTPATRTFLGNGIVSADVPGSSFGLDKDGDNLFVLEGDPTFIAGLTFKYSWNPNGSGVTNTLTTTSGELPSSLTSGTNAFALGSYSYGDYKSSAGVTGTESTLDAAINNPNNWAVTDKKDKDLPTPATPTYYNWQIN